MKYFLRLQNFINGKELTILTWKNLCFTEFSTKFIEIQGWLLLTFFICLHNQLSSLIPLSYRCLKNVIHQVDSKNEWLLLSVTFTAKLELVFVLTSENAFSWSFHFKAMRKSIHILLKSGSRDFRNSPPFERSAGFYVTISESCKRFQYFNFGANFLENENFFQKTGVPFFS